ncbi:Protein sco2 mitochondrial [Maudiozyma exigua]|uniref:Protein sco2 mitochondrial n=1 Tax=Maudiozyma exigua TaxID=34358 RepID=A0A9P6W9D6_MAUEX|nr:Protein sco2 mitochondrial [Kazachstania exigua]
MSSLILRTLGNRALGNKLPIIQRKLYLSYSNKILGSKKPTIEDDILKDIGNISLSDIKINKDISKGTESKLRTQLKKDETDDNFFHFNTWKGAVVIGIFAVGTYYFVKKEKDRLETIKEAEANRPVVGGPFELMDMNGNKFTEKDLLGHYSILYFGFTHCPDVCPAELDKLNVWLSKLEKNRKEKIQPLFITCDPTRDTPDTLKKYLQDFHSSIVGLTGTYDQIKDMCKTYKVFFSTPRDANPKSDYIVDHSTFFYLLDPEGKFIDALGDIYDEKAGLEKIEAQMDAYMPQAERERRMKSWYSFLLK